MWSASEPAGGDFWHRIGPRGGAVSAPAAVACGLSDWRVVTEYVEDLRMLHDEFLDGGWVGHGDGGGLEGIHRRAPCIQVVLEMICWVWTEYSITL